MSKGKEKKRQYSFPLIPVPFIPHLRDFLMIQATNRARTRFPAILQTEVLIFLLSLGEKLKIERRKHAKCSERSETIIQSINQSQNQKVPNSRRSALKSLQLAPDTTATPQ